MGTSVTPEVVSSPAKTVIGMVAQGVAGDPAFGALWGSFPARAEEIQHVVNDEHWYGVCRMAESGLVDYMAAREVEAGAPAPAGMVSWEIPTTTYVRVPTTLATIMNAFDTVYNNWLPSSGYSRAAGPDLEDYGPEFNPDDPASIFHICVPVTAG
jgi:AraC family transcriptional regulator